MTVEIPVKNRVHLAYLNGQLNRKPPKDEEFTSPEHISKIFEQGELKQKKNLTIYIHGGIVSASDNIFEDPFYISEDEDKGSFKLFKELNTNSYPVFFIWETGVIETLKAMHAEGKFKEIFKGITQDVVEEFIKGYLKGPVGFLLKQAEKYLDLPVFKALQKYIPEALDSVDEYGAAEVDDVKIFEEMLEQDAELRTHLEKLAEAMIEREEGELGAASIELPPETELYSTGFLEDVKEDYKQNSDEMGAGLPSLLLKELFERTIKALVAIYKEVKRRRKIHRDHDIWPSTVEEALDITRFSTLFAAAWDQMKENARETYEADNPAIDKIGPRGGRHFIENLAEFLLTQPRKADGSIDFEVSLVGHSAGSIHISYFLAAAKRIFNEKELTDFTFKNVILLAPAVNVDTFCEQIIPNSQLIRNFRIFALNDDLEREDKCAGLLYPHSLLYLVSGSAEHDPDGDKPLLGLQRHLDKQMYQKINGTDKNVQKLHKFFDSSSWSKYVVYSTEPPKDNPPGENTPSKKHGDFDNDPATQKSIVELL